MHVHLDLVTHIGEQAKMFVKILSKNANSTLTCLTNYMRVGTLARRQRSALYCRACTGRVRCCVHQTRQPMFSLHKFRWSTYESSMHRTCTHLIGLVWPGEKPEHSEYEKYTALKLVDVPGVARTTHTAQDTSSREVVNRHFG
jgi:hypothetical protein